MKFNELFKSHRKKIGSLRKFCYSQDFDPIDISAIERGITKISGGEAEMFAYLFCETEDEHIEFIEAAKNHVVVEEDVIDKLPAFCPPDVNLDDIYNFVDRSVHPTVISKPYEIIINNPSLREQYEYRKIAELAHQRWELEGRPDGEQIEVETGMKIKDIHWQAAKELWENRDVGQLKHDTIETAKAFFDNNDIDMVGFHELVKPLVQCLYKEEDIARQIKEDLDFLKSIKED